MYGFIPILLFSKINNYKNLISYLSFFYLILFILSIRDPFIGYPIYYGYMSFGLFCSLPSFILFHIERKYYDKKIFLIPEILSILTLLYSNRNSILVALIFVFVLDFLIKKNNIKKMMKYFVISVVIGVLLINIGNILNFINNNLNINSYAIKALISWSNMSTNGLTGRDVIWKNAINELLNNPVIGMGIGGFHAKYGYYCHNVILDLYLSLGIIFGSVFIIVFIYKIRETYKNNNNYDKQIFLIYILAIGILPLMFNNYFMAWKYFWIALYFIFNRSNNYGKESVLNE